MVRLFRHSIHVDLLKGEEEPVSTMFSPLTKNRSRAIEYVILIAERRGYTGIKVKN
tara:strand:- start:389 stop:556 length:168 start_codon:yes stop_codon:yes gene_type:complete